VRRRWRWVCARFVGDLSEIARPKHQPLSEPMSPAAAPIVVQSVAAAAATAMRKSLARAMTMGRADPIRHRTRRPPIPKSSPIPKMKCDRPFARARYEAESVCLCGVCVVFPCLIVLFCDLGVTFHVIGRHQLVRSFALPPVFVALLIARSMIACCVRRAACRDHRCVCVLT
jgi:hypothetical protein